MKAITNRPLLLSVLAAAFFAAGAAHAEADETVKKALAMAQGGQAKAAFDMLDPMEVQRAGDPDFDTVFGIAANESGQFTRAVFALERALTVQPENARARAELGRALFALGDNTAARKVLQETKDQPIPAEAAATIDQFLRAIEKAEDVAKSSIRGYVEFGIGNDSNVNSGPANANIAVPAFGGLVLTLNPSGVKTRSSYATLGAGLLGRYVIDPRWSLVGNASASVLGNKDSAAQAFDTDQVDVSGGVNYRLERNDYTVVAQVGSSGVGHDRARDQAGLVGEWVYRIDGLRQFDSYLQWSRLSYPGQTIRDVHRTVLGTTYANQFNDGLLAYGGAYIGQEATIASGVDHLGHHLYGVRAGVQKPIRENLGAFVTLGYEERHFGGTDPLFLVTRKDEQLNLNVGLSWSPAPKWRVTPQVAYTRAKSNVVISDYNKVVYSIVARREF